MEQFWESGDVGEKSLETFKTLNLKQIMRIIPAIDIIDGKCVRLSKGLQHQDNL
jgi:hypothetical protein